MIWALLVLLGIPVWLVALVLVTVLRHRHIVLERDDTFRLRQRTDGRWSRRLGVARWVSDVLIQHQGVALVRSDADQIAGVDVVGPTGDPVRGLGPDTVELRLMLVDHDEPLRIAVTADALDVARGPFRASPG